MNRGGQALYDEHESVRARPRLHGTTILGICRDGVGAIAGDGQVTYGDMIVKHGARKVRRLHDGEIVAGFAGAVADAMTLFEKFEIQLRDNRGDLRRASIELAREWRTDRYLRRLEAQLIVGDAEQVYVLSGEGDVIQPDDGIVAIGTGAPYAMAAARALVANTKLSTIEIVQESMRIASELCVFTNAHIIVEVVALPEAAAQLDAAAAATQADTSVNVQMTTGGTSEAADTPPDMKEPAT